MSHFSAPGAPRDPAPRAASTIVLLRPGPAAPEVFLLERHGKSAFLGGAFVFPGGKVDPGDAGLGGEARFEADRRFRSAPGSSWTDEDARRARVAGVRETFEEAGVLFARRSGETGLASFSPEERSRFDVLRRSLDGAEAFAAFLKDEGLEPALEALIPFAHWVTPSAEPRRFDTRFYLASMPEGQRASSDDTETVSGRWLTLRDALRCHDERQVLLVPPTYRVLEQLSSARTVEAALALGASHPIPLIQPKIRAEEVGVSVVMPWHPDYTTLDGEGIEVPAEAPECGFAASITVPPPERPAPEVPAEAQEVLHFWFGPEPAREEIPEAFVQRWYKQEADFDQEIRTRFGALYARACQGELVEWEATPEGALAQVILLDQFSRNLFRDDGAAFAQDHRAAACAEAAIARGDDRRLAPPAAAFLYMPLMHAEDLDRQEACVLAFERQAEKGGAAARNSLDYAHRHREQIRRFGRFPHRNSVLGRNNSPEEEAFLASGKAGF